MQLERDIIGQVCWCSHAVFIASDYLQPGNFAHVAFRHIWRIAYDLASTFEPVDLVTIRTRLHDTDLKRDGFFMSRFDLCRLVEAAADPRLCYVEHLPYHCLHLVELGIRQYLYNQTLQVQHIPAAMVTDFRQFQRHILLADGHNDLFVLLEKAATYFAPLPDLTRRIAATDHLMSQKAEKIKARAGKQLYLQLKNHYENN